MSTVPAVCGGTSSTVMCVAFVTVKHGALGVAAHGVALISVVSTVTSVAL